MLPKKTYTVKEVASLLGFSTNTVYKYLDEGKIKSTRFGKEGRFRIPDSEVQRLLQEGRGTTIQTQAASPEVPDLEIKVLESKIHGSPSLFDWFIAFLSISLGFSQFIFPTYYMTKAAGLYTTSIAILHGLLFFGGFALIAFDVTRYKNNIWHKLTHIILGLIYFILSIIFISTTAVPNGIGYLAVAGVLFLTASISISQNAKFLIFVNLLLLFTGLGALIWPGTFFLTRIFEPNPGNLTIFFVLWALGVFLLLILSYLSVKRSRKYFWVVAVAVALITLVYAMFSFSNGLWGRAVYCIVLASFSIIFPFGDQFESFTLKSRKEIMGSFLWLLGLFLVGTLVLRFVYSSFETYAFAELTKRAITASDIVANFMDGNVAKVTSFANDPEIINFLEFQNAQNLKVIDETLKQLYQASDGTLRRAILINKDGIIIDTYPFNLSSQNLDVSARDYYKAAKLGRGASVSGILQPSSPGISPAVLISVPIIDNTGTYLGDLTGSADLDELTRRIGQVKFGANGTFLLADSSGYYIIPPDPAQILTKAPNGSLILSAVGGKSGVIQKYDEKGDLSLMAYKKIDNYGWGIVAQQPFGDVFASYSLAGFVTFLVFIISGVGSLVLVVYLRKKGLEKMF